MDGLEPPACPLLRGPLSRLSYISIWWSQWDSNPQPTACKAVALSSWSYDPRSQLIYVLMELPTTHTHHIFFISSSCYVSVELFSDFFAMLEKSTNQWCGRRDSNPYPRGSEPKSDVSANFTTPGYSGGRRPTPAFATFKVIRVITYQLL